MMVLLVVLCGAAAVFVAGWAMARTSMSSNKSFTEPLPELPSSESMYAEVLERHPTGVVIAGTSGAIEFSNGHALEMAGTHVGVLVDEATKRHLLVALDGASSSETLDLYGPPRRVATVSSEPLPSGRAVAFIDDITDRCRADQARTDFVANVSHELRTPIGALMVLAETLANEDDRAVTERVAGRMQVEGDRAARMIDDLLELSQVEAGREPAFGRVGLADVVCEAVNHVAELAAVNDITISTLDPARLDGSVVERLVVCGDRAQLTSAVRNLVENAVKYSDQGGVVQVWVRRSEEFGEISVVDHGVGIPRLDLDRVFERFYRVDRARSRETGGTGLGLSIVRHVANNHDGSVAVESIEGEGSTFTLRLPLLGESGRSGADEGEPDDGRE